MLAKAAIRCSPPRPSTPCVKLLPQVALITPNLPEAAALLDAPHAQNEREMKEQGNALLAMGCRAVLMKGGHLDDAESPDWLFTHDGAQRFTARAYRPKHPRHGLYALGGAGGAASPKRELGGYGTGGEDLALGRAGKSRFSGSGSRYWAGSPFSCMVVSRILA